MLHTKGLNGKYRPVALPLLVLCSGHTERLVVMSINPLDGFMTDFQGIDGGRGNEWRRYTMSRIDIHTEFDNIPQAYGEYVLVELAECADVGVVKTVGSGVANIASGMSVAFNMSLMQSSTDCRAMYRRKWSIGGADHVLIHKSDIYVYWH